MICNATVVLPLDSGPYISITLPLGTPPSPNAISRLNEPVGIASILKLTLASPSFIIEPLPNCFSILEIAASSAFNLFSSFTIIILISKRILIISYIVITIGKLSVPAYKQIVKMLYNHEHLFVINII